MKKIHIAIAVLATATLISCQQERSFDNITVGENEIAFVIQGNATRSADVDRTEDKGTVVNLGRVGESLDLLLEETVTDLNGTLPKTRGIPIYTENVGTVYKDQLVVYVPDLGEATYEGMDSKRTYAHDKFDESENPELGWRYRHVYSSSPWPDDETEVQFYLRMPDDMTSKGVTFDEDESKAFTQGKTTFTYLSPTTAAGQQDIIFTFASMTKPDHQKYLPNGYPVTFYHALTGVKFAIGNELKNGKLEMGIQVNGITFKGLNNTGTCTVDAGASTLAGKVTWKDTTATPSTNLISQSFEADNNVVTYDEDLFPESFFENQTTTGNTTSTGQNEVVSGSEINHKDDASYTFWLIPQNFANSSASIIINYTINGVNETKEIPLKQIVKSAWTPGQLRTYTLKLNDVNLKIEDQMNTTATVKDQIVITNTGNTDAFIRASLVGQWHDAETDVIVFGFRDEINTLYLVESWYQDQFGDNALHKHGEFVGLAGYKDTSDKTTANNAGENPFNGWVLCDDNYYYYMQPVKPGDTTAPLFDSYTLGETPKGIGPEGQITVNIYFTLEIATQAISANDPTKFDGTNCAWDVAWQNADVKNKKPVQK